MSEKPGKFEQIVGKVERAQEKAPQKEGDVAFAETWASPEEGAEELYALWRDYNRKKIGIYKEAVRQSGGVKKEEVAGRKRTKVKVDEAKREPIKSLVESDSRLGPLQNAMRARFQNKQVRIVFERNLEREITAEEKFRMEKIKVGDGDGKHEVLLWEHYMHQRRLKDKADTRRLELYSQIFSHDIKFDKLTELELADIEIRLRVADKTLLRMEKENPELAARISFERLTEYRRQFEESGFMWTPSRKAYFDKIMYHLTIVNRNHPIMLVGETGTGKTQLARMTAMRLTGKPPYEVGEEAKSDIRPLVGLRGINKGEDFVRYGPLGQAATGKESSLVVDEDAGDGGIFYMDDAGEYPPDAQRSIIKQLAGRRPGERITFATWGGKREKLAKKFGIIESTNLPSEKHPDRQPLPLEVKREFAETNGVIEIEYPPQTPDNPELYKMMLAALMDQNDRIRVAREELTPEWKEVADTRTETKRIELNTEPKSGGTLWRFANFVAEIQKSYQGKENVLTPTLRDASYFQEAVLSTKVLIWLDTYRKTLETHKRTGTTLVKFLIEYLNEWGSQKIYPEEDRNLINKFQEEFGLI